MPTEAIYVEANTLIAGNGLAALQTEAAERDIKLYAPNVAVREFVEGRLREAKKCFDQISASTDKMNRLMGQETMKFTNFTKLKDQVQQQAIAFIQAVGIQEIATPPGIDVHDLIDKAIRRETPFKDKGRGFKDAIILETIMYHMKGFGISNAIFLTMDNDFSGEVGDRFQREGLALTILRSTGEALARLSQEGDEAFQEFKREKEAAIRNFLKGCFAALTNYVKSHAESDAEFNEHVITGHYTFSLNSDESVAISDKITDCRLQKLETITYLPGASTRDGEEFKDVAWIDVITEVDFITRGYASDFLALLSQMPGASVLVPNFQNPTRYSEKKTVSRKITLKVDLLGNLQGYYSLSKIDANLLDLP